MGLAKKPRSQKHEGHGLGHASGECCKDEIEKAYAQSAGYWEGSALDARAILKHLCGPLFSSSVPLVPSASREAEAAGFIEPDEDEDEMDDAVVFDDIDEASSSSDVLTVWDGSEGEINLPAARLAASFQSIHFRA